jgi:hypothetical protein
MCILISCDVWLSRSALPFLLSLAQPPPLCYMLCRVTDSASLALSPSRPGPFPPCPAPGCAEQEGPMGLYACVDSVEWVERLAKLGVKDIQLRIKVGGRSEKHVVCFLEWL